MSLDGYLGVIEEVHENFHQRTVKLQNSWKRNQQIRSTKQKDSWKRNSQIGSVAAELACSPLLRFICYSHFQGLLTYEFFTGRWISNAGDELVSVQEFPEIASRCQMSQTDAVNRNGFVVFFKATMESIGFCDLQSFRFEMLLK